MRRGRFKKEKKSLKVIGFQADQSDLDLVGNSTRVRIGARDDTRHSRVAKARKHLFHRGNPSVLGVLL